MARRSFDLGDYQEVADRIARHRDDARTYPDGSFVVKDWGTQTVGDRDYVWVWCLFYRTPDDPQPGHGLSWLQVPGPTTFNNGSELENAETSARGRALVGALAADTKASRDEVASRHPADATAQQQLDKMLSVMPPEMKKQWLTKLEEWCDTSDPAQLSDEQAAGVVKAITQTGQ